MYTFFWDLTITLEENGSMRTCVYRKNTSTNSLLHWGSYHAVPLKWGIPIGQYLRAKRNCSDIMSCKEECDNLYRKFWQRSYPKKPLHRVYVRATPRSALLSQKPLNLKICCVGMYDTNNRNVIKILTKCWTILRLDPDLMPALTHFPSVTYRRGRNLKDMLVHGHLQKIKTGTTWLKSNVIGSHPCGDCRFCHLIPTKNPLRTLWIIRFTKYVNVLTTRPQM